MSEILVKDLSYEAHSRISLLLLPPNRGRDWKTLADKMGYPLENIRYYECREDPVRDLISDYESKGKPISELLSFLEEMERDDLIQDLQKFIDAMPTRVELAEQKRVELEKLQTQAEKTETKTTLEKYDVFISYAEPDQPFAAELCEKLERPPFCMKVCIDYRDFLPGSDRLETATTVIENQCGKVLLILSEDFNRCEDADFQANVALRLSHETRTNNLIPILYKSCEIPTMIKHITRLNYTSKRERQYFWVKLSQALGCSNGS